MSDLTQQDWASKLENDGNAVIIDVRTEAEIAEGFIPGALHMDIYKGQEFIDAIKELDTDKNYYIYCRSGARSGQTCSIMKELGFESTYNLEGGFMNWNGPSTL